MAPPNRTRLALLGFLSWGPMSGYGLRKLIDASISNFWTESYGQIYPMLRQLEREGLAKSTKSAQGKRGRTVYTITAAGRAELERWLAAPVEPRPLRNELLLKLFFGARSETAVARRHLETYRAERAGLLARYAKIRIMLEGIERPPPHLPWWLLTLAYGEREAKAQLQWAESALAGLAPAPRKESRHAPDRRKRARRR
jgi:DNA-binding PadR family transcriptional regulator